MGYGGFSYINFVNFVHVSRFSLTENPFKKHHEVCLFSEKYQPSGASFEMLDATQEPSSTHIKIIPVWSRLVWNSLNNYQDSLLS